MSDQEKLILLARAMKDLIRALSETSCWYMDDDWDEEPWWPFVHAAEYAVNKILDEATHDT